MSIVGDQNSLPFDKCRMIEGRAQCNWEEIERFYGPGIYTTNNYLYVMYKKPMKANPQELTDYETEIHVFDWDVNAIKKMALGMYTYSFVVDEKNNSIYALDKLYNEVQMIVKYDMEKISKWEFSSNID